MSNVKIPMSNPKSCIDTLFCLFVPRVLFAMLAEFGHLEAHLDCFLILIGVIIRLLAINTFHFNKIIL